MIANRIKIGDAIGICSPSQVANKEEHKLFIQAIRKKGFEVIESEHLYSDTYGYLASPMERASDFNQLIADDRVKLVFFDGGEGSNELIPYIDFENIKKHPKLICSFSDGTTILGMVWARTGLEVYYGQAPFLFSEFTNYDEMQFVSHMVEGNVQIHTPNSPWLVQTKGVGEGILLGGYARNFALLLGSKYFGYDERQKYVLFIEDHEMFGSVAYVSAMLSHIEHAGFMEHVTGFIFGHYSKNLHQDLLDRLKRIGEQYQIPVVYCDDFGHGENHCILPIGRKVRLDTNEVSLKYL